MEESQEECCCGLDGQHMAAGNDLASPAYRIQGLCPPAQITAALSQGIFCLASSMHDYVPIRLNMQRLCSAQDLQAR